MATHTFNLAANFLPLSNCEVVGNAIVPVYDQFAGSVLDANKWTKVGTTPTVGSGVLTITGTATADANGVIGKTQFVHTVGNYYQFKFTGASGANCVIGYSASASALNNNSGAYIFFHPSGTIYKRVDGSSTSIGSWTVGVEYTVTITCTAANTFSIVIDGGAYDNEEIGTAVSSNTNYFHAQCYDASYTLDDVKTNAANSDAEFIIADSSQTYTDAGSGNGFDNSTAANTSDFTPYYQNADYAADQSFADAAAVEAGASWGGSWLSLAQLQTESNTGLRFRYLKCKITGNASGAFSSFSIDDYVVDVTPPALPTLTKFAQFGVGSATHVCLVWTEPEDADFDFCVLKKVVDGTTYYLNDVAGVPTWQTSEGDYFTFAVGDSEEDCCVSHYVDESVAGISRTYYVRAEDVNENASAWQAFSVATGGGGVIPCTLKLSL